MAKVTIDVTVKTKGSVATVTFKNTRELLNFLASRNATVNKDKSITVK